MLINVIKKLPSYVEFWFVITFSYGLFVYTSLLYTIKGYSNTISDAQLYSTAIYEIIILSVVFIFLRLRGWKVKDFDFRINLKLTGIGLLLYIMQYQLYFILYNVVYVLFSEAMFHSQKFMSSPGLTLKAIMMFSIVNPVFEETLVVAFIVKSLEKKYKPFFIITVSIILRFSYHTYQGIFAFISIIPLGLIFAYYYWRWKKLWPLIFAHMLANLIGLALLGD